MISRTKAAGIFLGTLALSFGGCYAVADLAVHGYVLLALVVITGAFLYVTFVSFIGLLFPRAIYGGKNNLADVLVDIVLWRWMH